MAGMRLAWACRKCIGSRWLLPTELCSTLPHRLASASAEYYPPRRRPQTPRLQMEGGGRLGGNEGTPRRAWNLPKGVQNILRADVLNGNGFNETIFRSPYPVVHNEKSQELVEQFFKLGEKGKEQILLKLKHEELEDFLSELAISRTSLSFEEKSLISDVSVLALKSTNFVQRLKLTDLVYVCGCLSDSFMGKFLDSVTVEWSNLKMDQSKLLQLLFYISLYRNAPPRLIEQIETYLVATIEQMSPTQMGLVCNAFFASNHAIKDYTILRAIAAKVTGKDLEETPLYLVCNIMKALRHAGYKRPEFYDSLANRLVETNMIQNDNRISNLSNISAAFASGRHSHPPLFEAICEGATEMVMRDRQNRAPRLKDLARIIFSCRSLQLPVSEVLVQELAHQVEEDETLRERFPMAFTEALLALAMVDVYIYPQLSHVFSRQYADKIAERNFEQHYQRLLLDTMVGLECPDYQETRLSPAHIATLVSSRDSLRGLSLHTRLGLAASWLTLEELFGGPAYVRCHYITNFTRLNDLEFRLDSEGRPQKWCESAADEADEAERSLRGALREKMDRVVHTQDEHDEGVLADLLREHNRHLNRKQAPNLHLRPDNTTEPVRKVTVKVLSENQYVTNKPVLLGLHQMELQALTKMGYEVLVINPFDAAKIEEAAPKERARLIKTLILKPLKIKL